MKAVRYLLVSLILFASATNAFSAGELIQLPLGTLQKHPSGLRFWEGTEVEDVEYYESSSLTQFFYSVAGWTAVNTASLFMTHHDPTGKAYLNRHMMLTGMLLSAAHTAMIGYRWLSIAIRERWQDDGLWIVPLDSEKAPPLLILMRQINEGTGQELNAPHYIIQTLYDPTKEESFYDNNEYLKLAKLLYKEKIFLSLKFEDQMSALSSEEELWEPRYSLSVSLHPSKQPDAPQTVEFSGHHHLDWVELLLSPDYSAPSTNRRYITPLAPVWIDHLTKWLAQNPGLETLNNDTFQSAPYISSSNSRAYSLESVDGRLGCNALNLGDRVYLYPQIITQHNKLPCLSLARRQAIGISSGQNSTDLVTYNHAQAHEILMQEALIKLTKFSGFNAMSGFIITKSFNFALNSRFSGYSSPSLKAGTSLTVSGHDKSLARPASVTSAIPMPNTAALPKPRIKGSMKSKKKFTKAKNIKSLKERKWYHGNITPNEADSRLKNAASGINGSFMVYDHPNKAESYVLLIYNDGEHHRWSIKYLPNEQAYVLGEEDEDAPRFTTISDLIKTHRGLFGRPIKLESGNLVTLSKSYVMRID
ncbi:SH2 domain-containing protein [Endozoicomonas numazuensis]|uniref:SH2 domain-containing protein n=1 Tax=Endozoicomonas numazuensis TaxID=1137799 RepID=UPI000B165302|nr:SH2 domain-containing protein [Endozoicomonas numazuensis]